MSYNQCFIRSDDVIKIGNAVISALGEWYVLTHSRDFTVFSINLKINGEFHMVRMIPGDGNILFYSSPHEASNEIIMKICEALSQFGDVYCGTIDCDDYDDFVKYVKQ